MSHNIHLRGINSKLMNQIKYEAINQKISMNKLILIILSQNFGVKNQRELTIYHDLDKLAGTWDKQKAKTFLKNIADFERIDKDIWK